MGSRKRNNKSRSVQKMIRKSIGKRKNSTKFRKFMNNLKENKRNSIMQSLDGLYDNKQNETQCEVNEDSETVINHVRKLLGDDSIEEYDGYRDDINLIQDLDLLIFSSAPPEYKTYCDSLRKEYSHLNDSAYNSMRLKTSNEVSNDNITNLKNPFKSPNNSASVSTLQGQTISTDKKNRKSASNHLNMENLTGRKLKKTMRLSVLQSNHRKRILGKNLVEVLEDCVLIEKPPEIIVIDDDTDILVNSSFLCETGIEQLEETRSESSNCTKPDEDAATISNVEEKCINDEVTVPFIIDNASVITLEDTVSEYNKVVSRDERQQTEKNTEINPISTFPTESVIQIDTSYDCTQNEPQLKVVADTLSFRPVIPPAYTSEFKAKVLGSTGTLNDVNCSKATQNLWPVKRKRNRGKRRKVEIMVVSQSSICNSTKSKNESTSSIDVHNENENETAVMQDGKSQEQIMESEALTSVSIDKTNNDAIINENNDIVIDDDDDDESVVFVCETPSTSLDFIPLGNDNNSNIRKRKHFSSKSSLLVNPFKKFKKLLTSQNSNTSTPKPKQRMGEIEFTHSEKKRNDKYNSNTYNPTTNEADKSSEKRMVIIDGSNVAFGHGNSNCFSTRGIEIAIDFFEKKGHEVKAVVPQFRVNQNRSTDGEKLKELHRKGKIVFTPGKNLPDFRATSYDDRFILQLALEFDAAIVSNDNYRDLINENPGFKKLIENRVITYSWCNDLFIIAKDPYGKHGPKLDFILNRLVSK